MSQPLTPPPALPLWMIDAPPALGSHEAKDVVVILPLAATEQHGPHLPLDTDVKIAHAYLDRVAKHVATNSRIYALPVETVGISTEHLAFPGTQSLTPEAAIARWRIIGERIAQAGVRRLVLVSSHGGNSAAMDIVALNLRARFNMLAVTTSWQRFGMPPGLFPGDEIRHGIHGGAIETSIMLAAWPDEVRREALADFKPLSRDLARTNRWLNAFRPAAFAWMAQDLNPTGAIGDATLASADKGEALLDYGARGFADMLGEVARFDLSLLRDGPKSI